ncbi:MAG: sugar transferase [Chitinophagaceae bacterium]
MESQPSHLQNFEKEPVLSVSDSPPAPSPEIIFFYLGKSPSQGKLLIDTFHSGFFLQDPDVAIPLFLKTRLASSCPVIIIYNGMLGKDKLQSFYASLPSELKSSTPIFVDATRLDPSERQAYSKLTFVNEMISLLDLKPERLLSTAQFIVRLKSNSQKIQVESRKLPFFMRSIESRETLKRVMDICLSALAIVVLSPLLLVIALAIVIESRGPILYISKRAGRGYRVFDFFKFRTMIHAPDASIGQISHLNQYTAGPLKKPLFFKATNDPRITRVGALLRSTSLDELPQFFNVLIGDMSLVGNRPLPLYEAETLTSDECAVRFLAPAGITGLWQITKRSYREMSAEERLSLDISYAHNNNLLYDLWIMANTPSALIQKSNA